ncbi:YdhK family protein (plasmid) [Alkalihalophilus sp. As8PL]|uniref:YdhK family protein n=1 Tax=Alkalihalophilus sp. As8PL TaxID=3237103 RepID=A0AB39BNT6_9BACI
MIVKKNKLLMGALAFTLSATLVACGGNDDEMGSGDMNEHMEENMDHMDESDSMEGMDHSGMDMSGSGEIPEGLEEAENPTFEVGDTAIITEAHMEGMEGAEATIVGAYDTVAYSISYDPTSGGERVEDHKWIIHEEITDAPGEPYAEGDEVQVEADHMEGMDGATATIDSVEETTVYMIDFPLESGEEVTNHKWVTESELSAE